MPTQAPQNSALYFQQAHQPMGQNPMKPTLTKVSPKNVQAQSQQQTMEMPHQTKYSPIRKDLGVKPAATNLIQSSQQSLMSTS